MEEVAGAGQHGHGQGLWAGPVEDIRQRDDVVLFAVDDERVGWHRGHIEAFHRRADEHHAFCAFTRRSQAQRGL